MSASRLAATVRGFIDHDIPLVVGVERGHHFNTIIGYWELPGEFFVYTAEPLDGFGRPYEGKPMRWQRWPLTQDLLDSHMFGGIMVFDHSFDGACDANGWARAIDAEFAPEPAVLCDYAGTF